jgi:hypothetical protein
VLVCVPRGGKRGAPHGGAPLFVLSVDKQAGLEPAGVVVAAVRGSEVMVPNFLSIISCRESFHGLGVQDVEGLILIGALFPLDERRREGKKKKEKITLGK